MSTTKWLLGLAFLTLVSCSETKSPQGPGSGPGTPQGPVTKGELTRAAAVGNLDQVKQLVARGADVNEDTGTEGNQVTPLLAAIAQEHPAVAEYLLTVGANASVSFQGHSPHDFVLHVQGDDNSLYRQLIQQRWNRRTR